MTAVILALGGNLGDREANIRAAFDGLKSHKAISKVKLSPMVESFAVTLDGVDAQEIETAQGRVRLMRWDSRTLDIDIITFGSTLKATKNLTLPHPRAYERPFVLVPWMLLDPAAVLPGHGSVSQLAADMLDQVVILK